MLKTDHNPGHLTGGSGGQYFVGDFDGFVFEPEEVRERPQWLDHGPDYYCAMQWTNEPERDGARTWVAWMSNWSYAADVPELPWRGVMTLPQEVALRSGADGHRLVRQPVRELEAYRGEHRRYRGEPEQISANLSSDDVDGSVADVILSVQPGAAEEVGVRVHVGEDRGTVVGYRVADEVLFVDRRASGAVDFHPEFAAVFEAPLPLGEDGRIELRIILDRSSVEVFGNQGDAVITSLLFPDPDAVGVEVYAEGSPESIEVDVWELSVGAGERSEE